ncbi:MAG: molybdopterin molybdenumtransferase MoeA, partial [Anaeromyxobacteraceae bacterium]
MERILSVREDVLRAVSPLASEEVSLDGASGRFLAAGAVARVASPPYACAAMDGFAVRAAD